MRKSLTQWCGAVGTRASRNSNVNASKMGLIFHPAFNLLSVKNNPSNSILLDRKLNRNFHSTPQSSFFNLKQAKKELEEKELPEQRKIQLLAGFEKISQQYNELVSLVGPAIKQFNSDPTTKMDPKILTLMSDILNYYRAELDVKVTDPLETRMLFFSSNIGMKIYSTIKKVEVLAFKSILQEWFDLEQYKSLGISTENCTGRKLYPEGVVDDYMIYNEFVESLESSAAYCPLSGRQNYLPYTKETLIGSASFLWTRLKDFPYVAPELLTYANEVLSQYAITKERYTTASIVSEGNKFRYDAHKNAGTYLEKQYSEKEFEWYEDLETNIPIHLGSMMKIIEATLSFDTNKEKSEKLLEESLELCPNNPYTYYAYASFKRTLASVGDPTNNLSINLEGVSKAEKALEILASHNRAILLPVSQLSCTKFEQSEDVPTPVERVNDFKFAPVHYLLSMLYVSAAESQDLPVEMRHQYAEKAISAFNHVENYSKVLHSGYYYFTKGNCFYSRDMFEQAISSLSTVQQFKYAVDPGLLIDAVVNCSNSMVALGYAENCIPVLDELIQEFNHEPRLLLQKIYCTDACCRSKSELMNVLEEYKQFSENCRKLMEENPALNYLPSIGFADAKAAELETVIADPNIAESW